MKTNPLIKETLEEISKQSIKYANTPDLNKRYLKRLIHIYTKYLNEEEQVYVLFFILENLHIKSIITDPDNILNIHNLHLRSITYKFILVIILVITVGIIYTSDSGINTITSFFSNIFKLLGLSF